MKEEKKVVEVLLKKVWHMEGGREPEGLVLLCWQCDSEHVERGKST